MKKRYVLIAALALCTIGADGKVLKDVGWLTVKPNEKTTGNLRKAVSRFTGIGEVNAGLTSKTEVMAAVHSRPSLAHRSYCQRAMRTA